MATAATITISGLIDSDGLAESSGNSREALLKLANLVWGAANGAIPASAMTIATSTAAPARAAGKVTISSGSGSIACVINGTSVSITWATSDINSAALLATAINANTTANKLVSAVASSSGTDGIVTVTANVPGVQGGAMTFTTSGTGATITGSGKLAGVTTGAGCDTAPTTYAF